MPSSTRVFIIFTLTCWLYLVSGSGALPEQNGPGSASQAQSVSDVFTSVELPWLAPSNKQFPYQGLHNDLPGLLNVQQSNGFISVCVFYAAAAELAINYVYSLMTFGQAKNILVGTFDDTSLAECQRWRLPCYNAAHLFSGSSEEVMMRVEEGSSQLNLKWQHTTFNKVFLVNAILKASNLSVHFGDIDSVYARPVYANYKRWLDAMDADATFMREGLFHNTGHYFMLNNERTRALSDAWIMGATDAEAVLSPCRPEEAGCKKRPAKPYPGSEQPFFAHMNHKKYEYCYDNLECKHVKGRMNVAAVSKHPTQSHNTNCPGDVPGFNEEAKERYRAKLCARRRLYLHIICVYGGLKNKLQFLRERRLLLVDFNTGQPLYTQATHPGLPCANDTAWLDPGELPF